MALRTVRELSRRKWFLTNQGVTPGVTPGVTNQGVTNQFVHDHLQCAEHELVMKQYQPAHHQQPGHQPMPLLWLPSNAMDFSLELLRRSSTVASLTQLQCGSEQKAAAEA